MRSPKVSVIIPSYNHQNFVGEAIESVLMQDYQDFELLIADDKSQDNSVEIIKQYNDERIQTFFLSENIGATRILEFLIKNSKGKYIALLNSDDRWCQGKLSKQVEFMEAHQEYAACFTWAAFIDENSNIITQINDVDLDMFKQKNRTQAQWIKRFFFQGNCLCHPSVLIKKSIYDELGYYNGAFRQLPDFEFWVRVCLKHKIHIINEVLVNHRRTFGENQNTSAVSTENTSRNYSEFINIFSKMFSEIDDELFVEAFKDSFVNKSASSKEEIVCEKYFLLANHALLGCVLKNYACQYFMTNYINDAVAECFEQKYNYGQKEFYKDNLISFIGDSGGCTNNPSVTSLCKALYHKYAPGGVQRLGRKIKNRIKNI